MQRRIYLAGLIILFATMTGCRNKSLIHQGTVSIPRLPSMEIDAPVALFVDIQALRTSALVRNLPSLRRLRSEDVKSFFKERINPCFLDNMPNRVWVLVPPRADQGAVALMAMNGPAAVKCLENTPGATKVPRMGVEISGTAYLSPTQGSLVMIPTSLMSRLTPGSGSIGGAKLLGNDPGAQIALVFSNMSITGPQLAKLVSAVPQGKERLTEWFVHHPSIDGAVLLRTDNDLELEVILDVKDEQGAMALAKRMEKWLQTNQRKGSVTLDHGAVSMNTTFSAREVDRVLSRMVAAMRSTRKGR